MTDGEKNGIAGVGMNYQLLKQDLFKPIKRSPPTLAVAISPDGNYALSSGLDFTMRKWDLHAGECIQSWEVGGLCRNHHSSQRETSVIELFHDLPGKMADHVDFQQTVKFDRKFGCKP